MPRAGGADDQPAARLARLLFAERVRGLYEKQRLSDDWAADVTEDERRLMDLLVSEVLE